MGRRTKSKYDSDRNYKIANNCMEEKRKTGENRYTDLFYNFVLRNFIILISE